ncbi:MULTISPECIES: hypothetical protein [Thioclava]|uniref:Uncharacterized protein n=1 Tax=Thioclava nitratireducens TaxID=1915078 RepID=A0ABM6IJZ5_9RHOB|nr:MULTISPECIES: hypothetical protein [Thioclava]AQS49132.1 hypothetical protein BMG03_16055 [Thioclava nitratireducens]OWY03863.1 hypothetical protein B6V75_10680 [Thioclava sp. F1Mire-8]OWY09820.1 hypothetical protein B6V74_07350 [Thioclava sp. F42-5]OWY14906.1 hypothetical protein B6V73_15510 [Thioclava sp. JM3]WGT49227.1 hypothetical protein P0N61_12975 [Thioclava nitratireducens]
MLSRHIALKFDNVIRNIFVRAEVPPSQVSTPRLGRLEDAETALEQDCARVVLAMPRDERDVLCLTYGLSGHAPIPPHRAADVLDWTLIQTMTVGEGAILRLRNAKSARIAFEPLLENLHPRLLAAADEIYEMRLAEVPRKRRDKVLKNLWCDISPLERLALRGFGDGEIPEMERALERRAAGQLLC